MGKQVKTHLTETSSLTNKDISLSLSELCSHAVKITAEIPVEDYLVSID